MKPKKSDLERYSTVSHGQGEYTNAISASVPACVKVRSRHSLAKRETSFD